MDIERKTVIDDGEIEYLIEYLSLILDNSIIIDEKYSKENGYKIYGHIKNLIEELEKCKK